MVCNQIPRALGRSVAALGERFAGSVRTSGFVVSFVLGIIESNSIFETCPLKLPSRH